MKLRKIQGYAAAHSSLIFSQLASSLHGHIYFSILFTMKNRTAFLAHLTSLANAPEDSIAKAVAQIALDREESVEAWFVYNGAPLTMRMAQVDHPPIGGVK